VLYLDRIETSAPIRLHIDSGMRVPLHCTASGKLFLSFMHEDQIKRIVGKEPLQAHTAKTLTHYEDLMAEIKKIADQGYALDNCEYLEGSICVAVPVRDSKNKVFAARIQSFPPGTSLSNSNIRNKIDSYKKVLAELSVDLSIPKYATHLVYMTNSGRTDEIEEKVMYSILQKRPKRADIYWFIHVNILNEPYKTEYKVTEIVKDDIIRIDFNLGFREPTKLNIMFKEVVKDMVKKGEVDITSRYESLNRNNIIGDFKFVLSEKFLSNDSDMLWHEKIVMNTYFLIKKLSLSEEKAFGLDSSSVKIEKFPMVLHPPESICMKRV
jgi:hypothetical protein